MLTLPYNRLANHGYLNRSGRDLTIDMILDAAKREHTLKTKQMYN